MDRISLSDFSGQVEAEAFRFQRSARGIERVSRTGPHGTERSRGRKRLRPAVPSHAHVWIAPKADQRSKLAARSLSATSRHMQCSKKLRYSISSSARDRNDSGIVRPSALAVFILMSSSKCVGCSTGRSAGWAPFRILSTYTAALRKSSTYFAE